MKKWYRPLGWMVLASALFVFPGNLAAEQEFAFSLAPAFEIPGGLENFGPGAGGAAALDWTFLPFLGVSAGGGFSSLFVADGSSLILYRGGLGPFLRWRPLDRWSFRADVRAGVYQYQWGEYNNIRAFAGGGLQAEFHLSPSLVLYAGGEYMVHTFANSPLQVLNLGAGIRLNLSEIMRGQARVWGEKTEQRRIFPVSYAWYKDNPAAAVRITNEEPNAITDVRLSLFMDRYMGRPEVFAVIPRLTPGESQEAPVTALFNEAMLFLTENVNANGRVLVSYRSLGSLKETEFPVQMPVYHRNALSWDDDRRAAAFVSPRDPAVRLFARSVAAAVNRLAAESSTDTTGGIPQNVWYAAALFESLAVYGMNYVIDPASSFIEMSEDATALDSLNYPYQTLYYRGGDCDDLSILFCSLLEVLGVDTAFITIPGHIYMAFDIGAAPEEVSNREGFIEQDGKLWMPVEITVPGEGFYRAWRIGLREWNAAAAAAASGGAGPRLYPMADSWALYPPVTPPGAGDTLPQMPEEGMVRGKLMEFLARWRR